MKRKLFYIGILVLAILVNICVFLKGTDLNKNTVTVKVDVKMDKQELMQLFYSNGIFDVEHLANAGYTDNGNVQTVEFEIPSEYSDWRLDFGMSSTYADIYGMKILIGNEEWDIPLGTIENGQLTDIGQIEKNDEFYHISFTGEDPHCIFDMSNIDLSDKLKSESHTKTVSVKIFICIVFDLFVLLFMKKRHRIVAQLNELYGSKQLVFRLAKNDFKTRFAGSYLGAFWAFIKPIITILVYWFVFQVGMKSGAVGDTPFVLWLIAGLVPWFFFSDALGSGTGALIEYQYLVKKIVFNIETLPIVKIISASFVHIFFVSFTVILYSCYSKFPDLYTLQLIYYSFCVFAFGLSIVYLTSAIVVFFRDMSQIIGIVLEVGIWMTPIMWQVSILPRGLITLFKLNPMYYIVSGYRDALINKVWFWDDIYWTIYFWVIVGVIFLFGTKLFNKLRVHFADVL